MIWWRLNASFWRDGLASSNLKMTTYDRFMMMTTTPHIILNIKWRWPWCPTPLKKKWRRHDNLAVTLNDAAPWTRSLITLVNDCFEYHWPISPLNSLQKANLTAIDKAGNSFYTGRLWHHMCSCQPTVGLTVLSLYKFCFHCTKSLFYSWLTAAHMVP